MRGQRLIVDAAGKDAGMAGKTGPNEPLGKRILHFPLGNRPTPAALRGHAHPPAIVSVQMVPQNPSTPPYARSEHERAANGAGRALPRSDRCGQSERRSDPDARRAQVSLPIGAAPSLAGATLHFQVAEMQFAASQWIVLFSTNGVSISVGVR